MNACTGAAGRRACFACSDANEADNARYFLTQITRTTDAFALSTPGLPEAGET